MGVRLEVDRLVARLRGDTVAGAPRRLQLPANVRTWCCADGGAPLQAIARSDGTTVSMNAGDGRRRPVLRLPQSPDVAAERLNEHIHAGLDVVLPGTLVLVDGCGVLLRGESGIGKSETALALLEQGHALVADDAVRLRGRADGVLAGSAPTFLGGRLAVHGLGVMDIARHFGESAVADRVAVELVVDIEPQPGSDPLRGSWATAPLLGRQLPSLRLDPRRPLAMLIGAAVRECRIRRSGTQAADDLERAQRPWMQCDS